MSTEDWTHYDSQLDFSAQQSHQPSVGASRPPVAHSASTHQEGTSGIANTSSTNTKTCNISNSRTTGNDATISSNSSAPAPFAGLVPDRLLSCKNPPGRNLLPGGPAPSRPVSFSSLRSEQSDVMPNSASGTPTAAGGPPKATSTAATTVPARSKDRKQAFSGPLMFRKPLPMATVAINGSEFFIHADLLCEHSDYFSRCLRGSFAEAKKQRIEINDDISVDDFGLWVDMLYRLHFHRPETFLLRKEETGGALSTMQILVLWKLSDRFLHQPLAGIACESLLHRLSLYSVEQWRKLYRTRPATDIRARVRRLQEAYRYCCDQDLPFINEIVTACANCPAQVYAECAPLLEVDFMMLVSQRMIMAHADSQLVSKDQQKTRAGPGARASGAGVADLSGLL
ncbi:hypothetical protein SEPCBS119000_001630 [Sporothrix epigloea]|uniref:BTB domain-containing protein n=1 Tax=Sporothrix epigloea TaxID=1892477 RepID=A0ABP0DBS1_9PEZI